MPAAVTSSRASIILPAAFVVGAALLIASYLLFLKPEYEKIMTGGILDVTTANAVLADREDRASRLSKLQDELKGLNGERRARLTLAMPSTPDIPGLFVALDAISRDKGFVVTSVDVVSDDRIVLPSGAKVLNVSLNVTGGTYGELKALLGALTLSLRILDVQSVVFTPDSGNYSLNIRTYYVPGSESGSEG